MSLHVKVHVLVLPNKNRIMMLFLWFCYHIILPRNVRTFLNGQNYGCNINVWAKIPGYFILFIRKGTEFCIGGFLNKFKTFKKPVIILAKKIFFICIWSPYHLFRSNQNICFVLFGKMFRSSPLNAYHYVKNVAISIAGEWYIIFNKNIGRLPFFKKIFGKGSDIGCFKIRNSTQKT